MRRQRGAKSECVRTVIGDVVYRRSERRLRGAQRTMMGSKVVRRSIRSGVLFDGFWSVFVFCYEDEKETERSPVEYRGKTEITGLIPGLKRYIMRRAVCVQRRKSVLGT